MLAPYICVDRSCVCETSVRDDRIGSGACALHELCCPPFCDWQCSKDVDTPGRTLIWCEPQLYPSPETYAVQALSLVDLYAERDVSPDRLYIKLASTWEGIRACEALEKQGIQCNLTLLFSFAQARSRKLPTLPFAGAHRPARYAPLYLFSTSACSL